MRRMPLRTQRRNTAYLNRQNSRFSQLDRGLDDQATDALTGLAIDLGGLVDQRFRPGDFGAAYLNELLHTLRRDSGGVELRRSSFLRFVRSNG
jgi:hypothetical protein